MKRLTRNVELFSPSTLMPFVFIVLIYIFYLTFLSFSTYMKSKEDTLEGWIYLHPDSKGSLYTLMLCIVLLEHYNTFMPVEDKLWLYLF